MSGGEAMRQGDVGGCEEQKRCSGGVYGCVLALKRLKICKILKKRMGAIDVLTFS